MTHTCQLDPLGTGNHSDDVTAVYHGRTEPTYVCGYHLTYWPDLVAQANREEF